MKKYLYISLLIGACSTPPPASRQAGQRKVVRMVDGQPANGDRSAKAARDEEIIVTKGEFAVETFTVGGGGERDDPIAREAPRLEEFFDHMPQGDDQVASVCARPGSDKVRDFFCSGNPPTITSLKDLQRGLGLAIVDPNSGSGAGGNPGFAVTAHSNAIAASETSTINPRVILYKAGSGLVRDFVAMGFVRGEQLVEMVGRDPSTGLNRYYLLKFYQACNDTECHHGDKLTDAIEKNWTRYDLYEDVDLENTVYDCNVCHQPDGPGTPKMLRMQNLQLPWPHWFLDVRRVAVSPPQAPGLNVPSSGFIPGLSGVDFNKNRVLIDQFEAAHAGEAEYAGIPVAMFRLSTPNDLAVTIANQGFPAMPNETAEPANSPFGNFTAIFSGKSTGWQRAYERSLSGEYISVPHPGDNVADPSKIAEMTEHYQAVLSGDIPREEMRDIREVLKEDEFPEMGLAVKAGLDGRGILQQACGPCHNNKLDDQHTRSRFQIDLDEVSDGTLAIAIERILEDDDRVTLMPPRFFKRLSDVEKHKLVQFLESSR